MAVITFPTALESYVAQQAIGQRRFDTFDTSDVTGAVDVVIGGPPRWTQQLQALDGMELAIAGQWDALMLQLRGGVNHLAMHDLLRPVPLGTARGAGITTASTTAAGATSVAVTGALSSPNLIAGGGMEIDVADLAVGWSLLSYGNVGTLGFADEFGNNSPRAQVIWGTAFGPLPSDGIGMFKAAVPVVAGRVYTLAADTREDGQEVVFQINWKTAAGAFITQHQDFFTGIFNTWSRWVTTATAPAGAALADVFISCRANPLGPSLAALRVDNVQFQEGTSATPFSGSPTLRAGDWLQIGAGVGSHYAKVVADVTLDDLGAGSVTFEPPTRQSYPSGTAVTIEKARGHYKRANSTAGWANVPGALMSGGHALELVEQWT